MKRKLLVLLIAIVVLAVAVPLGVLFYIGSGFTFNRTLNTDSAINCILEWGRLAPFPKSAKDLSITTEGGMFTRAFRATFTAPSEDIEHWIANSPGTSDLIPERIDQTTRKYVIVPGGGAAHAEVVIDDQTNFVTVYVYWS